MRGFFFVLCPAVVVVCPVAVVAPVAVDWLVGATGAGAAERPAAGAKVDVVESGCDVLVEAREIEVEGCGPGLGPGVCSMSTSVGGGSGIGMGVGSGFAAVFCFFVEPPSGTLSAFRLAAPPFASFPAAFPVVGVDVSSTGGTDV